ncbi:MAG: hypothetical protein ACRDFX_12600, partial [Chloroflexota bacterium]
MTVDPGITLTIDPGAVVNAQPNTAIQVLGILRAVGTADHPIILASSNQWLGIRFVPGANPVSTISYIVIRSVSDTAITDYPGAAIEHDTFMNDHIAIGGSPVASGNFRALDHTLDITNSDFTQNDVGITYNLGSAQLNVAGSYFSNNGNAIYVAGNYGGLSVTTSTFADNVDAIRLLVDIDNVNINQNSIYGSSQYNVELDDKVPAKIDATNNWWGTTSTSDIQKTLLDCNSDLSLPCVNYQPFLSGPPAGAPASLVNTAPTPTPPPTATPTPTPAATATVTATPPPSTRSAFKLVSAKVEYASANPSRAVHHPSLTRLKVRQRVKLFVYVTFSGITSPIPVQVGFRITCARHTTYLDKASVTVAGKDNGGYTAYWEYYSA